MASVDQGSELPVPTARFVEACDYLPEDLAERKQAQGLRVTVCIPAKDEQATIGAIVGVIYHDLVDNVGLVDEILVMDDSSDDATSLAARASGATVVPVSSVLPELGRSHGKGNALWRGLHVANGELIVYIDADISGFTSDYITGLLGPLLCDPEVAFTKACYDRPFAGNPTGGGRVTELVARPLISQFFPQLAGIVQPLSGEYAGRVSVLRQIPFATGWGVEIAMLIDLDALVGSDAIAQVDLGVRHHKHQEIHALGRQAYAIQTTVLRRAGVDESTEASVPFVRATVGRTTEVVAINVGEHPPLASL